MTTMTNKLLSRFIYVTYIRTTAERLWSALTTRIPCPNTGSDFESRRSGRSEAHGSLVSPDGRTTDAGDITAFQPSRCLGLRWRHQVRPELNAEGEALCTMELEPSGEGVKLTLTHSMERENSKLIDAVSGAGPQILSNLKSLLETGAIVLPPRTSRS